MGPFHPRFSERNDHDKPYQQEPEFHLRSTYEEEENPSSFDNSSAPRMSPKEGQAIRNLGFFKEQERQFTQGEEEEEWQERQSPLNFILIIGIFVALCSTGWLGYQWARQSTNHTPPLITADPTPFKVRPENPGGMVIPHQDKLVYGRLSPSSSPQVEHLLPPPEQLITPPPPAPPSPSDTVPPQPQTFVDGNGQVYYAYPAPLAPSSAGASAAGHPLPAPSSLPPDYPLPVQAAPSLSAEGHPLPPQAAAPLPSQQNYDQFPATPSLGNAETRTAPHNPAAFGQAPQVRQPTPSPLPREAAPSYPAVPSSLPSAPGEVSRPSLPPPLPPLPAASPAGSPTKGPATLDQLIEQEMEPQDLPKNSFTEKPKPLVNAYKIQVATLDSLEAARKEALRIKNIDPNLFKDKKLTTQAIKMGNNKTYRVLIEGFPTPNAAAQFSNKLRIHKVKGIVLHQPT